MSKVELLFGLPLIYGKICKVYPPKVKDVIENDCFGIYQKLLTISQEEIEDEFVENDIPLDKLLTPFEYVLNNAYNSEEFKQYALDAFTFFLHEPITILFEQKKIIIGDINEITSVEQLRMLDEENYFNFQNLVREALGGAPIDPPKENEDPRIKRMKAKARYRDRVKAKEGKTLKLETQLAAICYMGMGLNPLNIGELSYAAIPQLIGMYQQKEKYDIDIKSLLAGADSKKVKLQYWIRNLDDK